LVFYPKKSNIIEPKSQKNRGIKPAKLYKINFGFGAIFVINENKLFFNHMMIIKKQLKNFIKKTYTFQYLIDHEYNRVINILKLTKNNKLIKRRPSFKKSFLIHLYFNTPLTKKSKNSRMGKGKGLFIN